MTAKLKQVNETREKKVYKWDIVWLNVFVFLLLHLAALYGIFIKFTGKWQTILCWKILGAMSTVGVTAGAHRLWAHKSYTANQPVQILLMIMMSITYQNSIYIWCRDHRLHHKYSETDADPHNAKRGFFFSHMGWLLVRKHSEVKIKGQYLDLTDLEANPIVMFQHKYYHWIVVLLAVVLPTVIPMYFWNETFRFAFFTGTVYKFVISSHITWCINSLAHLYGNKPYDKNIGPTENLLMRYIGYGEGFHNYHHTFPWDYKAAELGGDVRNITTIMIDSFAWLGWVTNRKTASSEMIKSRIEKSGDGTLNDFATIKHFDKNEFNFLNFMIFMMYMIAL